MMDRTTSTTRSYLGVSVVPECTFNLLIFRDPVLFPIVLFTTEPCGAFISEPPGRF